MIEPTLALQSVIGNALESSPSVIALVPPEQIRTGSTRPDNLPSIIMAGAQTQFLGNASGAQYVARVFLDLHIWALEDGANTAKAIGFAVCNALKEAPDTSIFPWENFAIDEFSLPAVHWMRDPDPAISYAHGVITVEAVVRWSL